MAISESHYPAETHTSKQHYQPATHLSDPFLDISSPSHEARLVTLHSEHGRIGERIFTFMGRARLELRWHKFSDWL